MSEALWALFRNQKIKGLRAAMRQTLRKMERAGLTDAPWFNAMGELAMDEGNLNLALRFFQQACHKSEASEPWLNQGHALYAQGDFTSAEKIYSTVLARHPDDVHALVNRANCLIHLQKLDDAWELCEQGLKRSLARPALRNAQGQIAFLRGEYEQALSLFQQAYEEAPDYVDALFNQANVEVRLGQREKAMAHFDLCTRKDENFESAFYNRALLLFESGRAGEALQALQKALTLKPESPDSLHLQGRIHYSQGEMKLAREIFRKALRLHEDHLPSLIGLARVLAQETQHEEAVTLLKRILSLPALNPEDRKAALSVMLDLGQFNLALMHCERAADPAQNGLGLIHTVALWKTGKLREAIARMEKTLAVEGESLGSLTLLGMMLRENGALALAEPRLRRAQEMAPGDARVASELAMVHLGQDQVSEAMACLELTLKLQPENPDLLYNYACAQTRAGNRDDALTTLQKALESGFSDWDRLANDPDIQSLRQLKAFHALLGEVSA